MFLASAGVLTSFSPARAATSCADLTRQRDSEFAMHAGDVRQLGQLRAGLSTMHTDDPAVVDREYKHWTVVTGNYREKFARMVPWEQKSLKPLMSAFEDAL